ncbi:nitrogen regulatory protein P-II family [Desulfotomaculum arcticum]|uniref:Nitrogen regulatory protein P-II family n=1 Tax=Desulfotruncus arcticus DSM 17038 TaxID=1121424 RepID=A0A1I2RQM7_9FIRM|nr:P-II family nitrogen regulator [Desulfotruncus arcticus]SFG40927.1 nitrogen regulatory protein P-II family [Desulfotomaculum arcticum] [Desulfotruncus arcticus DSM 17038]
MTKLECILRPGKLEDVKDALNRFGIHGITVTQVIGCGLQKGRKEVYRGTEYSINLLPKVKLEIIIDDKYVDDVAKIISETARSGEIGDGKIFIYKIDNAVRIRTGETGEAAI